MTPIFQKNLVARSQPGFADFGYPAGYSAEQAFHAIVNVKSYRFDMFFADVGNAGTGGSGTSRRRWNTHSPNGGWLDLKHTFDTGQVVFLIDWSDVRVQAFDSGRRVTPFYYPRIHVQGVANNLAVGNEPFGSTDGQVSATVDWPGASFTSEFQLFADGVGTIMGTLLYEASEAQRYDTLVIDPADAPVGSVLRVYSVLDFTMTGQNGLDHFAFEDAKTKLAGVAVGNVPAAWNVSTVKDKGGDRQYLHVTVPRGAVPGQPIQIWTADGDSYCTRTCWWG